jgi:hypothetical protein
MGLICSCQLSLSTLISCAALGRKSRIKAAPRGDFDRSVSASLRRTAWPPPLPPDSGHSPPQRGRHSCGSNVTRRVSRIRAVGVSGRDGLSRRFGLSGTIAQYRCSLLL